MSPDRIASLAELGPNLSPAMVRASQLLFAPLHAPIEPDVQIERDLAYGPDERHQLDIYRRTGTTGAAVLVYVHGGGFVAGDKQSPDSPYYGNIGAFAARNGMVGVAITYRLAPASRWPSGAQDLARTVAWLRAHIAEHGGDPDRIYLVGQSAGAAHVASYVAHPQFHTDDGIGIAGAVMSSCIFDPATASRNPFNLAYYGENPATGTSNVPGLIASDLPMLFTVSEHDVGDFRDQASAFVRAYAGAKGSEPRMIRLADHNHLSPVFAIGTSEDDLGPDILRFIAATQPA